MDPPQDVATSSTSSGHSTPPSPLHSSDGSQDGYSFVGYLADQNSLPITKLQTSLSSVTSAGSSIRNSLRNVDDLSWNWHTRFDAAVQEINALTPSSTNSERIGPNENLISLSRDFCAAVRTYGRVIIAERHLPPEHRTIPIAKLGGIAGGEKYIACNILFKFAIDKSGLFGGDDGMAAKVAGHELKGLRLYYNNQRKEIVLPLIALFDFMGYRLLAISLLPISTSTLVYGSADGGRTIKAESEALGNVLKVIAQRSCIKSHMAGLADAPKTLIHSCADLEGHRAEFELGDGRFYLADFARVLPPESPSSSLPNTHLYRLLRTEFLRIYLKPLNPDAHSMFCENKGDNEEIKEASKFLVEVLAPQAAKEIEARLTEAEQKGELYTISLAALLHERGLNCRHMGLVHMTDYAAVEMVARAVRTHFNRECRILHRKLAAPLSDPFLQLLLMRLNVLLSNRPKADEFYKTELRPLIREKFPLSSWTEKGPDGELRSSLPPRFRALVSSLPSHPEDGRLHLLRRVESLLGVQFTNRTWADLKSAGPSLFTRDMAIDDSDIEEPQGRIKTLDIMMQAQGYVWKHRAFKLLQQNKDSAEAQRFLRLSIGEFEAVLAGNSCSTHALRNLGQLYWAQRLEADVEETRKALKVYERAMALDPHDPETLAQYAELLCVCNRPDAEDMLKRALRVAPDSIPVLRRLTTLLLKQGKDDEAKMICKGNLAVLEAIRYTLDMTSKPSICSKKPP